MFSWHVIHFCATISHVSTKINTNPNLHFPLISSISSVAKHQIINLLIQAKLYNLMFEWHFASVILCSSNGCIFCALLAPYIGLRVNNWFYVCYVLFSNNHDIEWQLPKNGGGDAVQEATTTSKTYILDPREKFLQGWNVVFVLSCVTTVALDPLFFYLPVIIQDKKCIWFDNRLWITVLVLRSFFDFIYLVHIILQFRTGFK